MPLRGEGLSPLRASPGQASRGLPRTWARVVGRIVYVAVAAPLLASVSDSPPEQWFLLGLVESIVFLLIIGTINWGFAHVR